MIYVSCMLVLCNGSKIVMRMAVKKLVRVIDGVVEALYRRIHAQLLEESVHRFCQSRLVFGDLAGMYSPQTLAHTLFDTEPGYKEAQMMSDTEHRFMVVQSPMSP